MKKVLSWVLALALVLSSFAISFAGDTENASKLKDANQITYTEAVDVMVATGVIAGYPDGYYYPAKAVKRAEMAKMIAVLVNGGEDVGDYYKDACKFADSKNHRAAGYIAYCANEGIIDGRDANTFDPEANVTATEAAKMLLVALGYDSKVEKFTGTQWSTNVLKLAKKNDFFDGIDKLNAGAKADRETAAQIIFNAGNAFVVEYDNKFDVTIGGDVTITGNATVYHIADLKCDTTEKTALTLFHDSFNHKLKSTPVTADSLGRPAHEWTYDGDAVGSYADSPEYTFVVSEAGTLTAAVEDWNEDFLDDYETDGVQYNGVDGAMNGNVAKGDVVELYEDDAEAKDTYDVVVLHYVAEQIAVDTEVTDKDADKDITAYVDLGKVSTNNKDLAGYDAATYKDEAVIAVAYKGGVSTTTDVDDILDTYVPEKVTGEVTKVNADTTVITVDGKTYDSVTAVDLEGDAIAVESTYDFYLINGYIAGAVFVEDDSADLYGMLVRATESAGTFNEDTVVQIITANGDKETFDVDVDEVTLTDEQKTAADTQDDAVLVTYTLNDDGEVDSLVAAGSFSINGAIKTNNILQGKEVNDDIVAFFKNDDDEWVVYEYEDLAAAEKVTAKKAILDGAELLAIKLTADISEADDEIIAFVTDAEKYNVAGDKVYYELTAFVEGAEKTFTTAADKETKEAWNGKADGKFYVLSFNSDDEVTKVAAAVVDYDDEILDSFADTQDLNVYSDDEGTTKEYAVYGKSGSSLDIKSEVDTYDYMSVGYLYVFADNEWSIEKLNTLEMGTKDASNPVEKDKVMFVQTSDASSTWNVAIKGGVNVF